MTAAYLVNFVMKNSAVQIGFSFKAYKNADELMKLGKRCIGQNAESVLEIEDDFGCKSTLLTSEIAGVMLNDMDAEFKKNADMRVRQDIETNKAVQQYQKSPAAQILKPANAPLVS